MYLRNFDPPPGLRPLAVRRGTHGSSCIVVFRKLPAHRTATSQTAPVPRYGNTAYPLQCNDTATSRPSTHTVGGRSRRANTQTKRINNNNNNSDNNASARENATGLVRSIERDRSILLPDRVPHFRRAGAYRISSCIMDSCLRCLRSCQLRCFIAFNKKNNRRFVAPY